MNINLSIFKMIRQGKGVLASDLILIEDYTLGF